MRCAIVICYNEQHNLFIVWFTTKNTRNTQAIYDNEELNEVRAPRGGGIAILGFKPAAAVGPHYTGGTARFMYPHEKGLKGSTAAFVALHKAMVDQVCCDAAFAPMFPAACSPRPSTHF